MSESYQSKQERRQRLLESMPEGLRPHVSVRNIEAVVALSPLAQTRLLEAVQAGLKRLPRAIEQLRANPETSVADLLDPPAPVDGPHGVGTSLIFRRVHGQWLHQKASSVCGTLNPEKLAERPRDALIPNALFFLGCLVG